MDYESLRKRYKPDKVSILFVGESRPSGGTFFYAANSNLYKYTKDAFEKSGKRFSLEIFKQYGCWLYDICEYPVNGLTDRERREQIVLGLTKLLNIIKELQPEYIVVVKKGDMQKIIFRAICSNGYTDQLNAFNLSFPACGRQVEYRKGLIEIIKRILT